MRKLAVALGLALAVAGTTFAVARGPSPEKSTAASHREAPFISDDPTADNTDVYAFVSPDRPDTVTLIANYVPFQEPAGGPNFYRFGDDVLYAINVDNTGDGEEDVRYEFRFRTRIQNRNTFLYNTGPIDSLDDPDFNIRQTYSVTVVQNGRRHVIGRHLETPPVNIGPRSTPSYEALADAAVHNLRGGRKVFAGQRDDPFFADLGSIFDLAGLRPFNPFHLIPLPAAPGVDGLGGYNVHTIAIQVPINRLTRPGKPVIGIYASAERKKIRILRKGRTKDRGPFVQVSRMGNPLINEVIIPLGRKDRWNATDPEDDRRFVRYYRNPELARLVNLLYPITPDVPETDREDLVTILLTGVRGLNFTGNTKADLLRLNTSIAPTAGVGAGNRLAVLAGDLAGFPNGRRLEDDVTDIEIRAVACGYGEFLAAQFGLCNLSPNNELGDGVDANDRPFMTSFPYVATPHQGYEHGHH